MRVDEPSTESVSAVGLRLAVVTATFNSEITTGLKTGAIDFLKQAAADEIFTIDVPGAFELPLIAQELAAKGFDAIICLGAVIEGDTDHYEHVAHRASEGLMAVQLTTRVPVALGVLTTRNAETAVLRSNPGPGNKGREAAVAAVQAARAVAEVRAT